MLRTKKSVFSEPHDQHERKEEKQPMPIQGGDLDDFIFVDQEYHCSER